MNPFNPIITYTIKNVYGTPTKYVTSEHAKAIERLTNKKTLLDADMRTLETLGFTFEHKPLN